MRRALVCLAFVCTSHAASAQWAQWRGPNRDGIVPAVNVPAVWPKEPTLKWKQPIGEGYSSPVVENGLVFVHSRQDPQEIVTAFDLGSGKTVWSATYPAPFAKNPYASQMSKGPFSTPIVANGRLFTLGVTAVVSSFDAATGALKWRKDFSKSVDTAKLFTGTAMSPIIASGLLVVHLGDDRAGAFRAFDLETGVEKWSLPGHGPGYSSPVLIGSAASQFATLTDSAVVGVDIKTGKLLWSLPFPDEWHENVVTPVMAGNVLVISGTRKGTFGYRLEHAAGKWTPVQVWHNAELPMYLSTPVADGSMLFGFSNKRKGQLFCLDAKTGRAAWTSEGRVATNASLLSAGPNLVVLTTDGELIVVRRSTAKYEELRRYQLSSSPIWAHPVLLRDAIVVRDAESIAVWGLSAR
ncbi:MAG: PQQ-binding-like beta-propeller repeat protein [Vicinamibacterales bacterium]